MHYTLRIFVVAVHQYLSFCTTEPESRDEAVSQFYKEKLSDSHPHPTLDPSGSVCLRFDVHTRDLQRVLSILVVGHAWFTKCALLDISVFGVRCRMTGLRLIS